MAYPQPPPKGAPPKAFPPKAAAPPMRAPPPKAGPPAPSMAPKPPVAPPAAPPMPAEGSPMDAQEQCMCPNCGYKGPESDFMPEGSQPGAPASQDPVEAAMSRLGKPGT